MGNWNINIQGIGAHHNDDNAADANKMARQFVTELQQAGHDIEHATFTFGGKEAYAGPSKSIYGWIRPREEVSAPPNRSAKPTAFTMDQVLEIQQGNPLEVWTNENFARSLESNRALLGELETIKSDPIIAKILETKRSKGVES